MRPRVTVVTACRNAARFLPFAIDSVLAQDEPGLDYLVLDGASTDATQEVLRSYGDRIRWRSRPDGGQSAALAEGFAEAAGDVFGWLNADDVWTPAAVRTAVDALEAHDQAVLAYGAADFIDEEGRRLGPCAHVRAPFDLELLLRDLDFVAQPAAFFRRAAYEKAGGLRTDLHWCFDYDLWIRLGRLGPAVHVPDVLAGVRLHAGTKSAAGGLPRLLEIERMLRGHGRPLARGFRRHLLEARRAAAADAWREGRTAEAARQTLYVLPAAVSWITGRLQGGP